MTNFSIKVQNDNGSEHYFQPLLLLQSVCLQNDTVKIDWLII